MIQVSRPRAQRIRHVLSTHWRGVGCVHVYLDSAPPPGCRDVEAFPVHYGIDELAEALCDALGAGGSLLLRTLDVLEGPLVQRSALVGGVVALALMPWPMGLGACALLILAVRTCLRCIERTRLVTRLRRRQREFLERSMPDLVLVLARPGVRFGERRSEGHGLLREST